MISKYTYHLKLAAFLFFILSTLRCKTQNSLDFGEIRAEKEFSCDYKFRQRERACGLESICKSKDTLEVRLFVGFPPGPSWVFFKLTFNNGKWEGQKFLYNLGWKSFDSLRPIKVFSLIPKTCFDSIYADLKRNRVFTLPSQQELNVKYLISDGSQYVLMFKAGKCFRFYGFNNPEIYSEAYKNIKEFEFYQNIAEIFESKFEIKPIE